MTIFRKREELVTGEDRARIDELSVRRDHLQSEGLFDEAKKLEEEINQITEFFYRKNGLGWWFDKK